MVKLDVLNHPQSNERRYNVDGKQVRYSPTSRLTAGARTSARESIRARGTLLRCILVRSDGVATALASDGETCVDE